MINHRKISIFGRFLFSIIIVIFILTLPATNTIEAASNIWNDDFTAPVLNPRWSWIREDISHWSLTDRPGYLRIITQTGGVIATDNTLKNVLSTNSPAGDFQVTVKVQFNPSTNFQFAGFMIYQDDDNYVQINRSYAFQNQISFDSEVGATQIYTVVPTSSTDIYLRIIKEGNVYYGASSSDGILWDIVGSYMLSLTTPKITLVAGNNLSGVPEINADFDSISVEALPTQYDYTRIDHFSGPALDSRWSWLYPDLARTSLTQRPGFLRIITQARQEISFNILVQDRPLGDYQITTLLDFHPDTDIQNAGILIYMDDANYMMLGHAYCSFPQCAGDGVYFDYGDGSGGLDGNNFATPITYTGSVYLRLTVQSNIYSGYYSTDGTQWKLVGRKSGKPGFAPTKIGLKTFNVNFGETPTPEINADFDNFTVSANYQFHVFLPGLSK